MSAHLSPEEKAARAAIATAKRLEYDRERSRLMRAALRANPPEMTPELIAKLARRREVDRIRYQKKNAKKKAERKAAKPKPIVFAKPKPVKVDKAAAFKSQEAYEPPTVKRTDAPTPPARFAVTGPIVGGFATLGIGRYLS